MPKGYAILDIEIHDANQFPQYMAAAQVAIEQAGGRYLVRGGKHNVVEGDWDLKRLVIVEFASQEAAEDFYVSDLYQNAMEIRQGCSTAKIVMVEGV